MRIGIVAHNIIRGDGQGRINYEIVRHCLSEGHHVVVLADKIADELIDAGATCTPIRPKLRQPNLLKVSQFKAMANRHVRHLRAECDVIVANGCVLYEPQDVNLCQFVHGAWLRSPVHVARLSRGPWAWYQSAYSRFNARWERTAYDAAKVVVAPSQKIRDELVFIGVSDDRIRVIHNGVDLAEFFPRSAPDADPAERLALGLPAAAPLALFVGDIRTPRKNLDSVLKALALVSNIHLAVVGDVIASPYPALARQLGVANRTTFAGYRQDVDRFMRAADLFVFPSRYEAGTLVLIEALASGLPVITARTAGGCEIMDERCGIVLDDPDDVAALASAMRRVATDGDRRQVMRIESRRVAEEHGWRDMAASYLALFEEFKQNEAASRQPSLCHAN